MTKWILIAGWLSCGLISYGANLAHSRIDTYRDSSCRKVNDAAVCDDRLMVEKSFFLIWGLAGGPASLLMTGMFTGFFHAGFQFT